MAGDWIKVENTTPDKPEVFAIAEALDIAPEHVTGCLVALWIWADQQTVDGNAAGVTRTLVDRKTGVTGFASAMQKVGWLVECDYGLVFPNFDRHNGKTAKNRALTAKRAAKHRQKGNAKSNGAGVTSALPREEKRREVKEQGAKTHPDRFEDFWKAYPTKREKKKAREAWRRKKLDARADHIIADVEKRQRLDEQWQRGYIPHPTTYINGERWEDEIERTGLRAVEPVPPSQRYLP